MFLSMTGFSSKNVTLPVDKEKKITLSVDMKSINSRFFEVVCKLPPFLNSLEIKIIQLLKEKLIRGRVYVTVRLFEDGGMVENILPSIELLEGYIKATSSVKKKFKLSGEITVSDLLRIPNAFVTRKTEVDKKFEAKVLASIDKVAHQLLNSRAEEGSALKKDLEKRFSICSKKIEKIKLLFTKQMKKQKAAIKNAMVANQRGDEEAKLKLDELYSTLNKIDIHEEITRFSSHLVRSKKIIKDNICEKGKRLDFILQELVRESNTMLAKCSNFEISSVSVDVKVELEKAREQTQNVV